MAPNTLFRTSAHRSPDHPSLVEFLESGWLLALNSESVLVGWGPWIDSHEAGYSLFAPSFYFNESAARPEPQSTRRQSTRHVMCLSWDEFAILVLAGVSVKVNRSGTELWWEEPSAADFDKQWQEIRLGMRERGLDKAVPVVFAKAQGTVDADRRLGILQKLVQGPRHLFPYGCWSSFQSEGIETGVLGATPELLFSWTEGEPIETVALAGTRAKQSGVDDIETARAFLNDAKERHEHQLVIDDIRSVFSGIGRVEVGETGVVELPTLLHLKTPIRVFVDGLRSFAEIAALMHPTPALGVAPRRLGFSEIRRWDVDAASTSRRRFGAPFGAEIRLADGRRHYHCVVAIRNIQWSGSQILLGSGCGIVRESEPEREWQELRLKRESVKRLLGL